MSGKFNGFSQDDINKIQTRGRNKENASAKPAAADAISSSKQKPVPKSAQPTVAAVKSSTNKSTPVLEPPAAGDTSSISSANSTAASTSAGENPLRDALYFKPLPPQSTGCSDTTSSVRASTGTATAVVASSDDVVDVVTEQQLVQPLKGVSLRDFESQRRMVEEQNRHKKAMLYKVIEQHSERTAAEAKKLHDIKLELAKLETNLATDVAILRKHIDAASLRYMKAQEHYSQVESVFLKAKLDLQKSREAQDLLAEHLNIIIANNEDRKARKLADLMAKVGLCSNGETASDASNSCRK